MTNPFDKDVRRTYLMYEVDSGRGNRILVIENEEYRKTRRSLFEFIPALEKTLDIVKKENIYEIIDTLNYDLTLLRSFFNNYMGQKEELKEINKLIKHITINLNILERLFQLEVKQAREHVVNLQIEYASLIEEKAA